MFKTYNNTIMIENYEWNDVILCAKGWYKRTGNIFKDFELSIRENKNYCFPEKMTNQAITHWMLKIFEDVKQKLGEERISKQRVWCNDLDSFYSKIIDFQERSFMLCNKNISFEESIILVIRDAFAHDLSIDDIKLNPPFYKKGKRRLGFFFGESKISMTYKEMNRIAQKSFSKAKVK